MAQVSHRNRFVRKQQTLETVGSVLIILGVFVFLVISGLLIYVDEVREPSYSMRFH